MNHICTYDEESSAVTSSLLVGFSFKSIWTHFLRILLYLIISYTLQFFETHIHSTLQWYFEESDSSIQDYDCSQPVYQWEKFDILNILIHQNAIDRGFNRKIGGFYRRVEGEKRNNHPIWRNRFAYEIAKLGTLSFSSKI